jgi:hypothetical protein
MAGLFPPWTSSPHDVAFSTDAPALVALPSSEGLVVGVLAPVFETLLPSAACSAPISEILSGPGSIAPLPRLAVPSTAPSSGAVTLLAHDPIDRTCDQPRGLFTEPEFALLDEADRITLRTSGRSAVHATTMIEVQNSLAVKRSEVMRVSCCDRLGGLQSKPRHGQPAAVSK